MNLHYNKVWTIFLISLDKKGLTVGLHITAQSQIVFVSQIITSCKRIILD